MLHTALHAAEVETAVSESTYSEAGAFQWRRPRPLPLLLLLGAPLSPQGPPPPGALHAQVLGAPRGSGRAAAPARGRWQAGLRNHHCAALGRTPLRLEGVGPAQGRGSRRPGCQNGSEAVQPPSGPPKEACLRAPETVCWENCSLSAVLQRCFLLAGLSSPGRAAAQHSVSVCLHYLPFYCMATM